MNGRPRILIVNLHSCRNVGDWAITEATLENLRRRFPGAHITLAANDPASHAGLPVDAVVPSLSSHVRRLDDRRQWRWDLWKAPGVMARLGANRIAARRGGRPERLPSAGLHRLLALYRQADLIVSCGGGIFTASHRLAMGPFWSALTLAHGASLGKPVYMMPQSVGPFATALHRQAARLAYSGLRLITARDPISQAQAESLRTGRPCHLAPDIAFALAPAPPDIGAEWLRSQGVDLGRRPIVGITVLDWESRTRQSGDQARYESALQRAIRHVSADLDAQVALFAQVDGPSLSEDDRPVLRRVAAALPDVPRLLAIETIPPPRALMSAYGHLDLLVGTRMHSAIFAAVASTPFLAIGYLGKAQGTFSMLGMEDRVVAIDALQEGELCLAIDRVWARRDDIRRALHERVPRHAAAAARAADLIADDWQEWRSTHG